MNNKPENDSCKDIAADLREDARQIRRAREIATRMEPQPTMRGRFLDEIFTAYADRLDAVAKPETVYNMAAMREALCDIVMLAMKVGYSIHGDVACGIIKNKAKRALSAPARNCDRFGGDIDKLREACARERGLNPEEDFPDVFPDWLLAPAAESGVRK